ncbi:MAG: hypothetical protein ACJ8AO_02985 [Gemmatimonadaceae bacterium]
MNDRGEYRPFYVAFGDDADAHRLSDRAYRLLTQLKLTLPASGIGVVYDAQLREKMRGCTAAQLEAAYRELETPKPGRERGWIVREGNVVWIVKGLRFEPTLSPKDRKHRTFVQKLVKPLGERPIVAEFRTAYAPYFEGHPGASEGSGKDQPKGHRRAIEGPGEGHRSPVLNLNQSSPTPTPGSSPVQSEGDISSASGEISTGGEGAPAAHEAAKGPKRVQLEKPLPPGIAALLRAHYGWDGNPRGLLTDRQWHVVAELRKTLTKGGATAKRGDPKVRAVDLEHLDAVCAAVAGARLESPDAAGLVALLRVRDTRPQTLIDREAAQRQADEREGAERLAAAEAWLAGDADAQRALERRLAGVPDTPGLAGTREQLRRAAVLALYAAHERAPPLAAATG